MEKNSLIKTAGCLWFMIGIFLIFRGASLYQIAIQEQHSTRIGVIISLLMGILIGSVKGYFVLSKSARKNKYRIQNLESPLKIHQIYSKSFYPLVFAMIILGVLLRDLNGYLGGYIVVASIYCGIGTALIVSSQVYWKSDSSGQIPENP